MAARHYMSHMQAYTSPTHSDRVKYTTQTTVLYTASAVRRVWSSLEVLSVSGYDMSIPVASLCVMCIRRSIRGQPEEDAA